MRQPFYIDDEGRLAHLADVRNYRTNDYLACYSLVNELHQNLVLERFCKEAESSRIDCGLAH